jgi:hypothetical protein
MEFIMKKEAAALQSATGQSGGGGATSNFHNTRVPFGAPSAKNYVSTILSEVKSFSRSLQLTCLLCSVDGACCS